MRVIAVVVAIACTGCSIFMTSSPRSPPAAPNCPTSKVPIFGDALFATFGALGGPIAGIGSALARDGSAEEKRWAITAGVFGLTAIVFMTSAIIGTVRVKRCQRAQADYAQFTLPSQGASSQSM